MHLDPTPFQKKMRWLRRHLRLLVGGPILIALVSAALFCESIAPADPYQINTKAILKSPSAEHPFGTDHIGRDILSRVVYGARVSLSVAAAAVFFATLIGVPVGLLSAYAGGRIENGVMRVIDVFVCLPEIFVAIVVMAFMQHSLQTLIFTIGLLYFPQFARVTYGVAASLKTKDYVLAAEALGASGARIVFREILPNMMSVIIVQISFTMSFAMLLEAGLSFLGLGVMPPQPSWGQMAGALKDFIFLNPWPVVFPSAVLFLAVFSINMIGDWLQDTLNPEIVR
ncbi:MAG: ABC transporter permease [Desulfobacterales bacterium]|jgi:peptide/nickel transport system permease protein